MIQQEKQVFLPKNILEQTIGSCHKCLRPVPAFYYEKNGKMFYWKSHCGEILDILVDNDAELFKKTILKVKRNDRKNIILEEPYPDFWLKIRMSNHLTQIFVTSHCNMNCPICYWKYHPTYKNYCPYNLSTKQLKEIIKDNPSSIITLTGGEPTTRKDLPSLIKIIAKHCAITQIVSNGIKLTDDKYVKTLKKAGLKEAAISFDGFRDEMYEIYRGRKLLETKLKAVEVLSKNDIEVCLMSAIGQKNKNQVKFIIDFASKQPHIELILFLALFEGDEKIKKFTRTDIIKAIEDAYDNFDVEEYFSEWSRFKINISEAIDNIIGENNITKVILTPVYPFVKGSLKPLVAVDSIRRFNNDLEKNKNSKLKTLLTLLKHSWNKPRMISYFISGAFHRKFPKIGHWMRRRLKIFQIWIGHICTPNNVDWCRNIIPGDGGPIKEYTMNGNEISIPFIMGQIPI